jgi:hypothetical protein
LFCSLGCLLTPLAWLVAVVSWATCRCGNLQAILLGGTYKITDDALAQVIARAGAKLQVVNLAGCEKLTSASVMAIAHHCPNLRVFNMSDCNNVRLALLVLTFCLSVPADALSSSSRHRS